MPGSLSRGFFNYTEHTTVFIEKALTIKIALGRYANLCMETAIFCFNILLTYFTHHFYFQCVRALQVNFLINSKAFYLSSHSEQYKSNLADMQPNSSLPLRIDFTSLGTSVFGLYFDFKIRNRMFGLGGWRGDFFIVIPFFANT